MSRIEYGFPQSISADSWRGTSVSRIGSSETEIGDVVSCVCAAVSGAQERIRVTRRRGGAGAFEAICGAAVAEQVDDVWIARARARECG